MNNHALAWTDLIHARDIVYSGLFVTALVAYVLYRQIVWRVYKFVVAVALVVVVAGLMVGVLWAL